MTPAMREAQLERIFRSRVRMVLGGMVIKMAPTVVGVPDRMVLLPGGRVFLVELKAERGVLSAAQREWHLRARRLGTHVVVLRGLEQIQTWVEGQHR